MKWLSRAARSVVLAELNLSVMAAVFAIFGVSLMFQSRRWASTPAYHVLLQIFTAPVWGVLFLASGVAMGLAAWRFGTRWVVIAALTVAFTLTTGWMLAFVARYLTSPNTTPETWVSWAVFDFLLIRVAASLDRPREVALVRAESGEISVFRQAVDNAITASAADLATTVAAALNSESARFRDSVTVACAAYAQALHDIVPAGAMPGGDPAQQAIDEARNALLRAEEAYARATGKPLRNQDLS